MNWDIDDPDHGYVVAIPRTTIAGDAVSLRAGEGQGVHILHVESPDLSEVYFEITTYPQRREHGLLAQEQRRFLAQNSSDGAATEPFAVEALGRPALSFDFRGTLQGRWKERRFLFVDGAWTYRIVYDPRSSTNAQILQSLVLHAEQAGGSEATTGGV